MNIPTDDISNINMNIHTLNSLNKNENESRFESCQIKSENDETMIF
jgi:hypothetical protein